MVKEPKIEIMDESLKKIDDKELAVPEFTFFNNFVRTKKKELEIKQKKQLRIFIVIAVFIISLYMMMFYRDIQSFMIAQIIIIIVPTIVLCIKHILSMRRGRANG
ncbi:MAG: DUF5345 family protein [Eubacteriales bacterium]